MKLLEIEVDLSLLPEKDYFDVEYYKQYVKTKKLHLKILNELGIKLRIKGDWIGWHHIIGFVFWVIGFFSKTTKSRFYNDFYTMFIDALYIPKSKVSIFNFLNMIKDEVENYGTDILRMIVHEGQHRFDYLRGSFKFLKSYATKKGRGNIEKRGYFWNIYFSVKENGYLDEGTRFIVKRALTGSMYLYIMPVNEAVAYINDAEEFAKLLISLEKEGG